MTLQDLQSRFVGIRSDEVTFRFRGKERTAKACDFAALHRVMSKYPPSERIGWYTLKEALLILYKDVAEKARMEDLYNKKSPHYVRCKHGNK